MKFSFLDKANSIERLSVAMLNCCVTVSVMLNQHRVDIQDTFSVR
jgi:hypothetical protein